NPDAVMVPNVASADRGENTHSTGVGHSIRIRWFSSTAITLTRADAPHMSQYKVTSAFGTSGPLPRENQKRLVSAGSTKAWNTEATGFRISIWVRATGTCVRFINPPASVRSVGPHNGSTISGRSRARSVLEREKRYPRPRSAALGHLCDGQRGCRNGPALGTAPPLWRRAEIVAATETKPVIQPVEAEQSSTAQEPPPRRRRQADE